MSNKTKRLIDRADKLLAETKELMIDIARTRDKLINMELDNIDSITAAMRRPNMGKEVEE